MTLLIRADATTQIGTGHVMRCVALAQAWQNKGGRVVFLSHCDSRALQNRIIDEGFDLIPIKNPHPHPDDLQTTLDVLQRCAPFAPLNRDLFKGFQLGSDLSDAKQNCSALNDMRYATSLWLTLDGYHFTSEYQKAIRDAGIRLLVIDDMNHLPHYHGNILLNQNINAEHLYYVCRPDTRLLLGTKYALLREEFWPWQGFKREIPEVARKILVTLGGGDPDNVTLKVIEAIKRLNMPDLEVQVIVGPSNPRIDILRDSMLSTPCPMRFIQNASNMPELMAWADVGILAGGSTCWEMAFMGLPCLLITIADNQIGIAEGLDMCGAAVNLGWHENISEEQITQALNEIIQSYPERLHLSKKGRRLVNGNGCKNVINLMLSESN